MVGHAIDATISISNGLAKHPANSKCILDGTGRRRMARGRHCSMARGRSYSPVRSHTDDEVVYEPQSRSRKPIISLCSDPHCPHSYATSVMLRHARGEYLPQVDDGRPEKHLDPDLVLHRPNNPLERTDQTSGLANLLGPGSHRISCHGCGRENVSS